MRTLGLRVLSVAAVALVALPARASSPRAAITQGLISDFDYDAARKALAGADPGDPELALERARLALHQLDCDGAVTIVAPPEVQAVPGGDALADVARGCQRVTAAAVSDKDDARSIEIVWQDEHDRVLAPLVLDTVALARESLTRDLGVDWPGTTRVLVVRDLLSLSAVTGLPYEGARTTGTVAVAKWGRVTILSPRASPHGYPWRDTLTHELSHLAVTRATHNRAPLWLQEGVAKREEVRWRDPGPFDFRPSPESIVTRGREQGVSYPLDKLGPSIALLPSADAATIAFAEVTSFVRYYVQTAGDDALPRLLGAMRDGADPNEALLAVSGADLKTWESRWRAHVAGLPRMPFPAAFGFGEGGKRDRGEREGLRDLRERRDRSRLAELLLARDHGEEAVQELQHTGPRATPDPSARWLWGRALEAAGRRAEVAPLVADPADVVTSYGPWWAVRGRWERTDGDEAAAQRSFFEAVAADPYDPEGACEAPDGLGGPPSVPIAGQDAGTSAPALCDAARAYAGPPFDSD